MSRRKRGSSLQGPQTEAPVWLLIYCGPQTKDLTLCTATWTLQPGLWESSESSDPDKPVSLLHDRTFPLKRVEGLLG